MYILITAFSRDKISGHKIISEKTCVSRSSTGVDMKTAGAFTNQPRSYGENTL